ncbi:MAG: InlB B-repeat-containing protein, partial [Flavobacteriaceae bacterium]|nr:InlB B-repeat-containing protein [Flavobacteriaceae bacterium]
MKRLSLLLLLVLFSCTKDPVMYDITISSTEGGTVSPQSGSYEEGSSVTFTATPSAEYEFTKWSNGSTQNPLELTVTSDLNIQASFAKKQYELTITKEGEGAVNERVFNSGKGYDSGTRVELTAVPAGEWVFSGWSGDINTNNSPIIITLDSPKNIKAKFVKRKYPLTVNFIGQGTVTEEIVNTGRTTDYDSGTTIKLTAQASDGWEFIGWSGALSGVANPQQLLIGGSKEVTVEFKRLNPIYVDENGVTIKAYDWAEVGESGFIDNTQYTIVDKETLQELIWSGADLTKVVTSKVVDMQALFLELSNF